MQKRFKCVLFDLDGTLVTTGGAGIRALNRAFKILFGLEKALDQIDCAGKTDPAIVREIIKHKLGRDCSVSEMKEVQEKYLEFVGVECEAADDYRVMEGIPEILKRLQAMPILMGLGTGNLERGARKKLHRSRLNDFFPFGGYGSDAEDRGELLQIGVQKAEKHGGVKIKPEDVYIVGDTERDIFAARKGGFRVIAAATGGSTAETLKKHHPDFFLPNFENVEEFVRMILNGD